MSASIWERLNNFFSNQSGFPEIHISNLSKDSVVKAYSLVLSLGKSLVGTPLLWDRRDRREKPVISVEDPAKLVVEEKAEPFHLLIRGIEFAASKLPDIGVFVFPHAISFDFAPGKDWGENQILAFLELIAKVSNLNPATVVSLEEIIDTETKASFFQTLNSLRMQD